MKKPVKIVLSLFAALIFLLCAVVITVDVRSKTLSANFELENVSVFVPKGIADNYEDPMLFSFDDARIWNYKLSKSQVTEIEGQLENQPWQKLNKADFENYTSILYNMLTFETIPKLDYSDTYLCSYDFKQHDFAKINSGDEYDFGSLLLLYCSKTNDYYAFVMSI